MYFKEMLEIAVVKNCPPEELRGACGQYKDCEECREQAFANLLELLERDYVEKERDTLEKIEQDVRLETTNYWRCTGVTCDECPTLIDGKTPRDFYEVTACDRAQMKDLLRRQREILEVTNAN